MLILPKEPHILRLAVGRLWNGNVSTDDHLACLCEFFQNTEGIVVRVIIPTLPNEKKPNISRGSRLNSIDEYDSVNILFVDEDNQYLEVIFGLGGSYLVRGFDTPGHLITDFSNESFSFIYERDKDYISHMEMLIPYDFFPTHLKAINAFLFTNDQCLAYHPLSGDVLNIHQPSVFPFVKME